MCNATDRHTRTDEQHANVTVRIPENFPYQKHKNYSACNNVLSVCVGSLHLLELLSRYMTSYLEDHLRALNINFLQ